ncbi:Transcription initiation factor IIA gamma subunit [Penicillium paradoxum]|uniref:Transcription initiation factor IIA gamma subunit n=1 Tax=Penicillium paradoxum TaxID=176176 RepID=UPI0025476D53|nr:Transcription initiation factor IIA gamma subunit [Penicillium paradoxum]KAJ5782624.1 Transcription initiation factor IIA gamma subunit [Penicillium paradoxum]
MASVAYYELYRGSSLGLSLTDTLDDLINEGRIEPQLAMKILGTFDKIVTEVLADKVRARLTFKGHLDTYRFCDEVWTFLIKDVSFKLDNQTTVTADKVKISGSRPHPQIPASLSQQARFLQVLSKSAHIPPQKLSSRGACYRFLIEGIKHDDGWVMVEDEFYAVAQTFTQHLHHAEYLRLRKEVKAANAAGLQEIERPTDGRTPLPKEVERKREAEALKERQKAGLAQIGDGGADEKDEDEDDQRWAGTHLHDLMTSPRRIRSLAGIHLPKSTTRAAAGFGQASTLGTRRARVNSIGSITAEPREAEIQSIDLDEETASGSDDDIDLESLPVVVQPPRRIKVTPQNDQVDDQTTPRAPQRSKIQSTSISKRTPRPTHGRPIAANAFKSRVQSLFDDLDELPESSRVNTSISTNTRESSTKQSSVTGGGNNLDPKKSRHNEVPTFLV